MNWSQFRSRHHASVDGAVVVLCVVAIVLAIAAIADNGDQRTSAAPSASTGPSAGFGDTVDAASPSVVQIRSGRGLGSGIVFDGDGHVVTNAHVVAGATSFHVTVADGSTHPATLRGTFPEGDLAVIEVSGAKLKPARFGDSSKIRAGEFALAIGNPLGLRSSVTQGIVSAPSRTVSEGNGVALPSAIQTSAEINPGNSGGALVDSSGAVIGVPTLAALDPQLGGSAAPGIGFAIASNTVRSIAPQLIADGRVVSSGRAWLGVGLRTMPGGGALVADVVAGGPAADAGIQPGELIVDVAGNATPTTDAISVALADEKPGATIPVKISGPKGTRTVQVKLGQTPAS